MTPNKFQDILNKYNAEIESSQKEYDKSAEDFFNNLSYEDKLKAFYHVVKNIHDAEINEKLTYRGVLYDKFKFDKDSYSIGMNCGFLDLHNSIYTSEDLKKNLQSVLNQLKITVDQNKFKQLLHVLAYGIQPEF